MRREKTQGFSIYVQYFVIYIQHCILESKSKFKMNEVKGMKTTIDGIWCSYKMPYRMRGNI